MGILYYVYGFLILRKESPLVHRNLTIGSQDSHCNVIWRLRRSALKGQGPYYLLNYNRYPYTDKSVMIFLQMLN